MNTKDNQIYQQAYKRYRKLCKERSEYRPPGYFEPLINYLVKRNRKIIDVARLNKDIEEALKQLPKRSEVLFVMDRGSSTGVSLHPKDK